MRAERYTPLRHWATVRKISGAESWGKIKRFGDYLSMASSNGVNIVDVSIPASAFVVKNLSVLVPGGVRWDGASVYWAARGK